MKLKLSLFKNELLPVFTTDKGNKVVNGRDLHTFLGIGKKFNTWAKDVIKKHNLIKDKDFAILTPDEIVTDMVFTPIGGNSVAKSGKQSLPKIGEQNPKIGKNSKGGRTRQEYIFLLTPSKKIAMGTNNAQGDRIKDYFLECESVAKRAINMPDLSIHTRRPVQIQNSKDVNRMLWETKDTQAIGEYHREASLAVCGKTPSQLKQQAKEAGLPSKDRTSGREVLRHTQPEAACALSLCDTLTKSGADLVDIKPLLEKAKGLYADIMKLGFTPGELSV